MGRSLPLASKKKPIMEFQKGSIFTCKPLPTAHHHRQREISTPASSQVSRFDGRETREFVLQFETISAPKSGNVGSGFWFSKCCFVRSAFSLPEAKQSTRQGGWSDQQIIWGLARSRSIKATILLQRVSISSTFSHILSGIRDRSCIPDMSSWMNRARGAVGSGVAAGQGQALIDSQTMQVQTPASSNYVPYYPQKPRDPNAPDHRLQLNSKCIYERNLPGGAYITCHVDRLQCGFYDSPNIHEDSIENVRFVALHFVFHPFSTVHRFTNATIRVSVHNNEDSGHDRTNSAQEKKHSGQNPSILRHAPHLLYGAISPETLQWNFNLAGNIGVSQMGASASINPSGGVKSSYKLYEMMRIQGSSRTWTGHLGPDDDVEDGAVVWTMEENRLQKSGLPREFTFIILLKKGDPELDAETVFDVQIEPVIGNWVGNFPRWYTNLIPYRPLRKPSFDLDQEIGQTFAPCLPGRGYNFANLTSSFEDFVTLPGTTYSATVSLSAKSNLTVADTVQDTPSAGPGEKTDSTKTPTGTSLQNSLILGQAKIPQPQGASQQAQTQGQNQGQSSQAQAQQPAAQPQAPQQQQQQQQAPSLFPNNTLNVHVTLDRSSSTALPSPLTNVRSASTRARSSDRPHSLRRSRSRNGLMKEYGASAKAREYGISPPAPYDRSALLDAVTYITDTNASASMGRSPLRKPYAEKLKDWEIKENDGYREIGTKAGHRSNDAKDAYSEKQARATPPGKRNSYPAGRQFGSV